MGTATPFLMFRDGLEEAVAFYTSAFPDSRVIQMSRSGEGGPVQAAEFVVAGQRFKAFVGGPRFSFSDGFSVYVDCEDQAEVDRYWDALVAVGATPVKCGWITDPWGLSWQIVPRRFVELISDGDSARVRAVMDAMLEMQKLDVAALEAAAESVE